MNCVNCGAANLENARFCSNCGSLFMVRTVCANCQTELVPMAKFCHECGVSVLQECFENENFVTDNAFSVKKKSKQLKKIVVEPYGGGDCDSISEALLMAQDGCEIFVKLGTYEEHLVIDKKVTIIGERKNNEVPIISGSFETGAICVELKADASLKYLKVSTESTIDHNELDFSNGQIYAGILIGSSAILENVIVADWYDDGIIVKGENVSPLIKKCEIVNNAGVGINVLSGAHLVVENSHIHHNSQNGVLICSDCNVVVKESKIHNTIKGVQLVDNGEALIERCEIYDCDSKRYDYSGYGVSVEGNAVCKIVDSNIHDFNGAGVFVDEEADYVLIESCKIHCSNLSLKHESNMRGVNGSGKHLVVQNCEFFSEYDPEKTDCRMDALDLYGSGYDEIVEIKNCKIRNCYEAIYCNGVPNLNILDTTIYDIYTKACTFYDCNVLIENCKINRIVEDAFSNSGSLVDVKTCTIENCQYIAHVSKDKHSGKILKFVGCSLKNFEFKILGDVDAVLFENCQTDSDVKIEGSSQTYNTITAAINAAVDGNKILIPADTYNESVVVDKKVSIVGVPGKNMDRPIIWCDTTSQNAVIVIESECSLSNLEIKGAEEEFSDSYSYPNRPDDVEICDWWPKCIYVKSKCSLSNLKMYYSAGHGIICGANAILEMKDCIAYKNSRMGLMARGNATGTISNCDFYENHLSGLSLCDGTTTKVVNCQIHENSAAGVICFNARPAIEDCRIYKNNNCGVCVCTGSDCSIQNTKINNNTSFGLLIDSNSKTIAENCDIAGNSKTGIKVEKAFASIKNCKIHNGGASGIFFTEAKGCVENCDIYENHCGVKVSKNSAPTIKNCKIHEGKGDGISFSENSEGVVENCNIFMNFKEPIKVSSDSKPTIKSNKVAGLETDDDCED